MPDKKYASGAPAAKPTSRLVEIDSLRGLAAMAVVLFHYTAHFGVVFKTADSPTFQFPYGYFGVNLFFIISGFVIFMTLERTTHSADFLVSRFSRLFPAYWVAIFMTYGITHALGLPGKLVDINFAVLNMTMIHGLIFRVPHVDGVYWTLEVELLFYFGMWCLYRFNQLPRIHAALALLLTIKLVYFALARMLNIDLPWTIYRLLILQYIPWFALGINIYLLSKQSDSSVRTRSFYISAFAIASIFVTESVWVGLLAVCLALLVWACATRPVAILRKPLFVWLGAISYPLYLLHENIGWSIQLQLLKRGIDINMTVIIALTIGLALATALTYVVEKPAMQWIRTYYKNSSKKI